MHDYVAAETAWRQDPALGIEFTARRLGLDPAQVLNHWAQRYADPNWSRASQEHADAHDAMLTNRKYENHPKNMHLRDPAARKWMSEAILGGHVPGKNHDETMRNAYIMYDKALKKWKVEQREAARQADMDEGARAEAACTGDVGSDP